MHPRILTTYKTNGLTSLTDSGVIMAIACAMSRIESARMHHRQGSGYVLEQLAVLATMAVWFSVVIECTCTNVM